ncbi:MAG: cation:dicarboxylase symporter family transporter [Oscillospiraceae bacterium]|nr:cation:dicarboxylase symporter family transporter [Oscillospiraceae bacterium]
MEKTLQDMFALTAAEIDRSVEETDALLKKEKIDPKDALRLRFMLEETMLQYRDAFSEQTVVSLRFSRFFGAFRVSLRVKGERMDPFHEEDASEASVMGSLLANSETLNRAWRYRGGANLVTFTVAKKRRMSQLVTILLGIGVGAAAGLLCKALAPETAPVIAERIITPLTNAFTGLLCVMATVMCFGAITLGIVRLGDISTFSSIGRRMIRSFLLVAFLLTLLNTAWMIPGMTFGMSSRVSIDFFDFFDILIDFVPNNILSPILNFNSVHIIIIGVMFGITMLKMGQKSDRLTEVIDEVNTVAILSNSSLNHFISVYVGLMVFGLIASGQLAVISGFWKLFLIVVAGEGATLLAYTLYVCIRLKVSVRTYLKKLLPSFMISLSSANYGAAFSTTIDTLIGPLGVDANFAPLAYNLGGILFRPGYCIVFTACSLFTANLYGVEVTWAWLLAAFLLSFILSVATPPVIGGTTVCFSILFSQLGIRAGALAMIISVNAIFEFLTVAVNNYCLQSQIVLLGNKFGKLDPTRLRK